MSAQASGPAVLAFGFSSRFQDLETRLEGLGVALNVRCSIWEFPKIGAPNIVSALNSRILVIRTPK